MALQRFHYYKGYVVGCDAWLVIAEDEETGVYWFPIRPTCKALRMDSPSQIEVIKGNWKLAPALQLIAIPTEQRADGTWTNAQQTQCLPWREFSWWLMIADPREAAPEKRDKLLIRQRAMMDFAESIMRKTDATLMHEQQQRTAVENSTAVVATGEVHSRCPVCNAPLCLVISGAHLVAGVEVE